MRRTATFLLVLVLTSVGITLADVTNGLVAYYALDGNADDASGNGYHGINTGVTFQPSQSGEAALFVDNTAKHIRVDSFPEIRSNLSISVWYRAAGNPDVMGGSAVTRGAEGNIAYCFSVYRGYLRAEIKSESGDTTFYSAPILPGITDLNFHHAVLVYSQTTGKLRLYSDGQLIGERAYSEAIFPQTETQPLYLGMRPPPPPGGSFGGLLDEVRIYNRALTAAEVNELWGLHVTIAVSEVKICWNSLTNRLYQVQYRSRLTTNEWVNVGAPISGTGETICVTDGVHGPQKFYRVVHLP